MYKPGRSEGLNHVHVWGKRVPGGGKSNYKPCSRSMIAVGGTGRKPAELEQDKPEENRTR